MNMILSEFTEEKKSPELTDLSRELIYFRSKISEIIQFDTVFNKLGRLYPHLSIMDCKSMAKDYINKGELRVHSGNYVDWKGEGGYVTHNSPNKWNEIFSDFRIWSCCSVITLFHNRDSYDRRNKGMTYRIHGCCYINIHTEDMKNNYGYISDTSKMYIYKDNIESIRGKNCTPITFDEINCRNPNPRNCISKITSEDLTKYVKEYGFPRPDTFCFKSKKLILE